MVYLNANNMLIWKLVLGLLLRMYFNWSIHLITLSTVCDYSSKVQSLKACPESLTATAIKKNITDSTQLCCCNNALIQLQSPKEKISLEVYKAC